MYMKSIRKLYENYIFFEIIKDYFWGESLLKAIPLFGMGKV